MKMSKKYIEVESPIINAKAYRTKDGIRIIKSIDNTPKWGGLLHISISRQDRYPSWDEIVEAKLVFFGDMKDTMMVIPKRSDYVNISNNCFHIWETPEEWGIK